MNENFLSVVARYLPHAVVLFLVGVAAGSVAPFPLALAGVLVILGGALLALPKLFSASRPGVLTVLFLLLALGVLRPAFTAPVHEHAFDVLIGQRANFEGVVVRDPDARDAHTNLTIGDITITSGGGKEHAAHAQVLLLAPPYPEFAYGDRVRFSGALSLPEPFTSEDGLREFNYPAYLAKDGVGYMMFRPNVEKIGANEGNPILAGLFHVKHASLGVIGRAIPEPAGALAAGLIFGEKRSLGPAWSERFRVVGLTHIVVLSGHNMTLVADGMAALLGIVRFGFYGRVAFGALGIVLFALMTGGGATVVRAAVMALLALLARTTGRTSAFGRMLIVAAGIMVAGNPRILLDDPSFQLSFLASLGLVFAGPLIEHKLIFLKNYPRIRELVVATIATQIFVLPLLLHMTGNLSLVALPANLLALPVVSFAMFLGMATAILGIFGDLPALITAFPAGIFLGWILLVAKYLALLPFAQVTIGLFPGWALALSYIVIGIIFFRLPAPAGAIFPANSDSDKKDKQLSPQRP